MLDKAGHAKSAVLFPIPTSQLLQQGGVRPPCQPMCLPHSRTQLVRVPEVDTLLQPGGHLKLEVKIFRSPHASTASSSVRPQVASCGAVNTADATFSYTGRASASSPNTFFTNAMPCRSASVLILRNPAVRGHYMCCST
jgi:hypothetical protein